MDTLGKDLCTFMVSFTELYLEREKFQTIRRSKHGFMFNDFYYEYRVYEICEKNITARQATCDSIILRMNFLYCITKATDLLPENAISIAFPRQ